MSVNDVRTLIWRRFLYLFLGEVSFAIGLLTGSNGHPSDAATFAYCGFIFGTFAMFLVDSRITDGHKNGEK